MSRPGTHTLRVSVLQQCQYDCAYCRPGSVTPTSPNSVRLTVSQYRRLAPLFAESSITVVRMTGGEPLLRPDIVEIVAAFRAGLPSASVALTTNGQRLGGMLRALAEAGLQRATIHVDSLRQERYRVLMGEGDVKQVLATVLEAQSVLEQVKLNVVVQRGKNDDEIPDFLAWSERHGVEVRFIELMNTGSAVDYTRRVFFSGAQIVAAAGQVTRLPRRDVADPAALYRTESGITFGVIASDTEPFCGGCNRLRLTSDGKLRGCLYQPGGAPVGEALRRGATDKELSFLIRTATSEKKSYHPAVEAERLPFSMADAGG